MNRRFLISTALVVLCGTLAAQARSQTFPDKPIRLIVGFAPGGPTDLSARIAAQVLSEGLGKPVIVENRAGASGSIAANAVAQSPADGYTLLVNVTADIVNPAMNGDARNSLLSRFTPIGLIASSPNVLVVHPSQPASDVRELAALARKNPDGISYASAGLGTVSHLSGTLFASALGAPLLHVPYKGLADAQRDLISGRVTLMFDSLSSALANAKAGKVRALAVTSPNRWSEAPSLPTMQEAGFPGVNMMAVFGLLAPAGTPGEIVQQISSVLLAGLRSEAVSARIGQLGAEPGRMTPADYAAYLGAEHKRWAELALQGKLGK